MAYGRDADTTAAIAGGLAGSYWGWGSIPRAWLRGMRGREIATPLVDRLVETTGWRTSTVHPLRLDALDLSGLDGLGRSPGALGITFLPGKKRSGWTGPWWRDVDVDLAALRDAGVDAVFLLVEDAELRDCLVEDIAEVTPAYGLELIRFPIRDPRPRCRSRNSRIARPFVTSSTGFAADGPSPSPAAAASIARA